LPKDNVCTKFKDKTEAADMKENEMEKDVFFQELNELTLFQLLSLLTIARSS
jgi:hypothetical protein